MALAANLKAGTLVADIGDAVYSKNPSETLKTYGLGSCVGVCIIDPASGATGMLHVQLPESSINPAMAQTRPFAFADTGLPKLVDEMLRLGASPRRPTWRVKIAGGAATLNSSPRFDIGKRNQLAVKKVLWKLGMAPIAEHVGGNLARTLTMRVGSPDVEIFLGHKERIVI